MNENNGHTNVIELAGGRSVLRERTKIVPIAPQHLEPLKAAAVSDNHRILAPTHVAVKGDEVLGYGSLGGLPCVNLWLDSKKVHAGDSVRLLETMEAILADKGVRVFLMPCSEDSPFSPVMERLGFTKLGPTTLWIKQT